MGGSCSRAVPEPTAAQLLSSDEWTLILRHLRFAPDLALGSRVCWAARRGACGIDTLIADGLASPLGTDECDAPPEAPMPWVRFDSLRFLVLSDDALAASAIDALAASVRARQLAQLDGLDISHNMTSCAWPNSAAARRLAAFATLLRALAPSRVSALDISANQLGLSTEAIAALGTLLETSTALRRLRASDNLLGPSGARVVAERLRTAAESALVELDFGWNEVGDDGAASLADALPHAPRLERLDLSGNRLLAEGRIGHTGVERLDRGLGALDAGRPLTVLICGSRPSAAQLAADRLHPCANPRLRLADGADFLGPATAVPDAPSTGALGEVLGADHLAGRHSRDELTAIGVYDERDRRAGKSEAARVLSGRWLAAEMWKTVGGQVACRPL